MVAPLGLISVVEEAVQVRELAQFPLLVSTSAYVDYLCKRTISDLEIADSIISDVPVGILTSGLSGSPNIILDNLFVSKVDKIVQEDSGSTLLAGMLTFFYYYNKFTI
jgi:hypothetical protein